MSTDRTAYRLGAGDVIDMRVFGKSQFDGLLEINEQGMIDVPFVDKPIAARCRTLDDMRVEIAAALTKYVRNPQLSLRLATRRPRPDAIVSGAVRVPQRYQLRRRVRLLELLASSGGVTDQASGTIQIFHTETSPCSDDATMSSDANQASANANTTATSATQTNSTPANNTPMTAPTPDTTSASAAAASTNTTPPSNAAAQSASQTNTTTNASPPANNTDATQTSSQTTNAGAGMQMPFTVYDLGELRQGRESANPFIEPGDVIVVQEAAPVYVTGAVVAPQVVYVRGGGLTLTRALARVGGLKKDAGRGQIRIYRQRARQTEPQIIAVDYDLVRANKQPDIALEAYDVIEVPETNDARRLNPARMLFDLTKSAVGVGSNLPLRVIN